MSKCFLAAFLPAAILFFISTACNAPTEKTVKDEEVKSTPPEIRSVLVNGDSLHYVDVGKGEPVVFIHGTLNDYRVWQMQLDTFSKDHRVIAYSRRYAYPNNQAYPDSVDYSPVIHAKDLAEFIKALNLGAVHLVGHSYGAYTALLTTIDHPELVKSVTLGEPPVLPLLQNAAGGDTIAKNFIDKSIIPTSEALKAGNNEKAVALFVGGVIGDTSFLSNLPPEVRGVILANLLEFRGSMLMKNPFPPTTCDDLKKIQTPVLLMKGQKTTSLFSTIINEMDKCLGNKESVTLPGATHGLQMDNPGEFNKIVLAFIDKY